MNFWPYCSEFTSSCSYVPVVIASIFLVVWCVIVFSNIVWLSEQPSRLLYAMSWLVPTTLFSFFYISAFAKLLVGVYVSVVPVECTPAIPLAILGGLVLGGLLKKPSK